MAWELQWVVKPAKALPSLPLQPIKTEQIKYQTMFIFKK
jgi:hypothetical protein